MTLDEARRAFIQEWGALGTKWGINRTMAQIHALLLSSSKSLCTEEIMEALLISRGNTNMNVRTLIDWGLVYKDYVPGERKEFFKAEKEIWTVTRRVMEIRKRQELEPAIRVLRSIKSQPIEGDKQETAEFLKTINAIDKFATQAQGTLDHVIKSDENWFWKTFLKLVR